MWVDIKEKLPEIGQPVIVGWLMDGRKEVEYIAHVRIAPPETIEYDDIFEPEFVMDINGAVQVSVEVNALLQEQGWVWAEYGKFSGHIERITGYSKTEQPTHWHPWPAFP